MKSQDSVVSELPIDRPSLYIGCAGWSIPKAFDTDFSTSGSHLERYAIRFNGVEINSSFYRPHRRQTYMKWCASVPDDFRFAVKVPKTITHEHRLKGATQLLEDFLEAVAGLGDKLGPLLVQLPPSLHFSSAIADEFFSTLRARFYGQVVCEPRHPSWFAADANELLLGFEVARVIADPIIGEHSLSSSTLKKTTWSELTYYRLHGSPVMYRSSYSPEFLEELAVRATQDINSKVPLWCVFDNTAEGAATGNALDLIKQLSEKGSNPNPQS